MAGNTQPIFPLAPLIGIATLTAPAAITVRTNIVGVVGLVALTPVSANGKRVDSITVKGKATTAAGILSVWIYNGVTSFLYDEFDIPVVAASNTVDSFSLKRNYTDLVLPPTYQLYVSVTVANELNVFANGGDY